MNELKTRYLEEYATPNKKPVSCREDERLWTAFVTPSLGKHKVSSITRDDITRLHTSLRHVPVSANRVLALLSKAFNLTELWGLRPNASNPCLHIKKYPERKRERFLSPAELERLGKVLVEVEQNNATLHSIIHAVRLLIFSGCRLNEILSLKWEYVDMDGHCLRLPDSKTGAKTVYLSPAAVRVLQSIRREKGNPYVITGHKTGAHLVNLQKPWRRIRTQAGLEDVRIHDLRHSFASIGAAGGLSLYMIGKLLGHKETATTERYAHLIGDPMREAANVIGTRLEAALCGKKAEILPLRKG